MKNKTVHIRTFGCQMNKLDSNLVANAFIEAGFELSDEVTAADVVLVNTCSVRDHAEQRVMALLGHMKHLKQTRPNVIVGVFGCMAQRLKDDLLAHKAVDIVCGPLQIPNLVNLVTDAMAEESKIKLVSENVRAKPAIIDSNRLDDFEQCYDSPDERLTWQAYVRVMRGCNNFCTYCIVPYVRGPEISRPPEKIVEQVKMLADSGVKQITLLGQTVNSYHYKDENKECSFAELLYKVSEVAGIEWIKFVTCYPRDMGDDILKAVADLPKVCPYLHMPAQSGSDRILKAMNRHYTSGEYLDIVDRARKIIPDVVIAGDFIVGFPGETEDDFALTAELIKKVRYKNSFIFKYSPRPGTRAVDKLVDDVPMDIKKQRNNELLKVQASVSQELNKSFVGKRLKVLVEGPSKKGHLNSEKGSKEDDSQLISRTAGDYIVVFDGPKSLAGNFAEVEITRSSPLTLFGTLQS